MTYTVFRDNIKLVAIKPLDSSELIQKSEESDYINLNFELTDKVELQIGDYIYYKQTNSIYTLKELPEVVNESGKFIYTCVFKGDFYNIKDVKCFLDTPKAEGGYYRDYNFELTGTPETFLQFIVDNMNRELSGYSTGDYIESSEQTITFSNFTVYEGILAIQEKFNFEWRIENKVIHFAEKTGSYAYILQVGLLRGLKRLERLKNSDSNVVTVVYGYGSTENLPTSYEGDGLYDKRLSFDGVDGFSKLENNTDKYGIIEEVKEFDIKPEFTGVVSGIDSDDLRVFSASNVPFDINDYLIDNVIPSVKFTSGNLSGTEFNVIYDSDTEIFTVDYITEGDITYPNETIRISKFDQFKILNIGFPDEYIADAETRLQEKTQEYIDKYSNPLQYFEGEVDEQYIQMNGIGLRLYDIIRVVSASYSLDALYSIKELTHSITNTNKYSIKFGDILPKNLLTKLNISNFNQSNSITNVSNSTVNNTEIQNIIGDENQWL